MISRLREGKGNKKNWDDKEERCREKKKKGVEEEEMWWGGVEKWGEEGEAPKVLSLLRSKEIKLK